MVLNQTSKNFSHAHELADLVIGDKGRCFKALWFGDLRNTRQGGDGQRVVAQ